MSRVYKCDRCGEVVGLAWLQLHVEHWASGIDTRRDRHKDHFDYCPDCADAIASVLVERADTTGADDA